MLPFHAEMDEAQLAILHAHTHTQRDTRDVCRLGDALESGAHECRADQPNMIYGDLRQENVQVLLSDLHSDGLFLKEAVQADEIVFEEHPLVAMQTLRNRCGIQYSRYQVYASPNANSFCLACWKDTISSYALTVGNH